MKILLLNSPWIKTDTEYCVKSGTRWAAIRKKDRSMPYFPFPYFLASATAVLKKDGFDAHIKDAIAEELTRQECMKYVESLSPQALLIEAFTPSIFEDLSFIKEAKEKTGCFTIFCGAHPTALPQEVLSNDYLDFVLLGEFDYILKELLTFIKTGRKDLEKIKGLAYKENGRIVVNSRREQIKDIDELPFPDRSELPMHKYNEPFSKYYPNAKIVTSRGCPYNCIFCTEPVMYERGLYKKRSIKLVIEEIKFLQSEYQVKEIFFDDPIFSIEWARKIACGIIESNLKIAWSCWMDWNAGLEDLKLFKKSGCVGIKFGVESANNSILKTARKPLNLDKVRELIKYCRKIGLLRSGSFMFGLPGETKKTLKNTIDLAFSLDLTSCQLAIATPLPGTPFYRMAKENGWLVSNDWRDYECHFSAVVQYPDCKKEDIEAAIALARKKKVAQLFRNPFVAFSYIVKLYQLKGFRGFYGEFLKMGGFAFKALFSKK